MTGEALYPVASDAISYPMLSDFHARAPWLNGDLQTLRNTLVRPKFDLSPWPERRLEFDLGDGDRLLAKLHRPSEPGERPILLLIHGLTGCEDSTYLRASAAHFLRLGYPVVRLNLRGAGPARPLAEGHYHAGRSDDLRRGLAVLADQVPEAAVGVAVMGYSLGGNMLLKLLGEGGLPLPIHAAASVSAPVDLKATQVRMMQPRNWVYHGYLLRRMKAESTAAPEVLAAVRSVWEFDERVVAPANGFAGAEDYYAQSAAKGYWRGIRVPTLIVTALDDPWIPGESYLRQRWSENRHLTLLTPKQGGHVGFHGRGSRTPWHDRCFEAFLGEVARQPARSLSAASMAK
ncbi:YheT family hydrolase [Algihabitans albus]|uniref:YheT family hydrolase n=1 Tax=Algihabitans albus TaxID=2164067 RepID=UPI0013C36FF0|nr:alpha/beta fold hydrolase [Algihabitans albus]